MSGALLAAFAAGAVPAFWAPQAGAANVNCTNATAGNPPECTGPGKAEITGGDYGGVYGTYPSNGGASGGSVKISGDAVMTGMVYGGRSDQGSATGNSVTISDRAKAQRVNAVLVYGGYSGSGNTTGNTVQMTGGSMGYMVIGGESAGSGNATGNTVKISGGTVQGTVYGGRSDQGRAGGDRPGEGNSVTISGDAVITRSVYGGQSSQGNATGNTVTISGGTVQGEVHGGDSNQGNAGGTASGEGNRVTISGDAVITRYVYGGDSNKGNATGNSVTIEGNAEIQSKVHGGESSTGLATGNSVTIEGNAKIQGEVYGGYSANNQATGNSVTLNGGTFTGASVGIYGARAGYNATATNNTITLGADFTGGHSGVSLWGGNTGWNGGDAVTGNTLNVNTGAGKSLTLGGVNNFEYLSFNHAGDVSVGALFRTSNLTKEGTGTLTLTAATNTHTGGAKVKAGTLELTHTGAAGTGDITVDNGATLRLSASGTYTNSALQGASGSTLEVMKNGAKVSSIGGFENYTFAANALSTTGTALTVNDQGGGAVQIDASKVKLDTTNGGLSLQFGETAGLMAVQNGTLTLTGAGAVQSSRLDNDPNGLIDSAYNLTAKGNALSATFDELYLYGDGGKNTKGQRESGNTLTLNGGTATAAYGGAANNGSDVTGNEVILNAAVNIPVLYGGHATGGGAASGNTVTLAASGNLGSTQLYGGNTGASGNTLKVQANGITANSIENFEHYEFSADALKTGTAALTLTSQGGTLDIEASKVRFDVGNAGLVALNGSATLIESTQDITLTGSAEQTGWLDGVANSLKATVYKLEKAAAGAGAKLEALVSELYLYGKGGTGASTGQRPSGNTLTFDSGEATAAFGGRAVSGKVSRNTVEMSKGELVQAAGNSLSGNLYGGYADAGDATDNMVQMTGGVVANVYGGQADSSSTASDNVVTVSGSAEVGAWVYGGRGMNATGNTVTLDGGTFTNTDPRIYGGFSNRTGGAATGNTITLGANLGANALAKAALYGGGGAGSERVSGNTLAVQGKGINVASIQNFENLYFILPANTNANDTMLTVNGGAATQFTAAMTNVGVGIAGGGSALQAGDTVTLLTNPVGLHNASGGELVQGTDYQLVTTGTQGFSLSHDFELSNDANSLHATVKTPPSPPPQPQPTPPQPKPQPQPEPEPVPPQPQPVPPAPQVDPRTKAVPESRVAVMGMLNLGADQIVRMTGNLPNRTGGGAPNFGGSGVSPNTQTPDDATAFADISAHRQKIETGSHVNVNGASAIVGAAKVVPLAGGGTAAVGAFFEYGDGSFKTHNDFAIGDVNGKGDSSYYGAGVLAKATLAGSGNGAPFVEGSLHAGSIHNNWHTDDLRDAATGQRAQYDIRTPYMGAHVGAGYRWQTGEASSVEAYGQYLHTHMDGKDTNVALDPYHFNAVKSSRTRLGAKGTWAVSERSQAYAGAAWEREFDGTARATAYSFDVPAPTMKGNSAVIDAGLTFQPKRNLSTNVGVTGYAGKRKGAAANVEVQYLF